MEDGVFTVLRELVNFEGLVQIVTADTSEKWDVCQCKSRSQITRANLLVRELRRIGEMLISQARYDA